MKYLGILLATLIFAASLSAETIVKLKLPDENAYIYWFSYVDDSGKPVFTQPKRFRGPEETIDMDSKITKAKALRLFILDPVSGNEAVTDVDYSKGKTSEITLKPSSFKYIRQVNVRIVNSRGNLIESALVTLTDLDARKQTFLLEPTFQGTAVFTDVPAGAASIKVVYSDGKTALQDIEIPLERDSLVYTGEVPVAGDVPIIKSAAKKEVSPSDATPPRKRVSAFETIISLLIGLVILGLVVSAIIFLLKTKGITAKDALAKIGAELPSGETNQTLIKQERKPSVQVPPGACPFCSQQKDPSTGACACSMPPQMRIQNVPRLVGVQGAFLGRVLELSDAIVSIGRGTENTIDLAEDNTVSRKHAVIIKQQNSFIIRDEGSSNGTFVNGSQVTEQVLNSGDEVQIGTTRFRFEA